MSKKKVVGKPPIGRIVRERDRLLEIVANIDRITKKERIRSNPRHTDETEHGEMVGWNSLRQEVRKALGHDLTLGKDHKKD